MHVTEGVNRQQDSYETRKVLGMRVTWENMLRWKYYPTAHEIRRTCEL